MRWPVLHCGQSRGGALGPQSAGRDWICVVESADERGGAWSGGSRARGFSSLARLGPRIGWVTALNDRRGSRLTGSLPLVQQSLAGVVMVVVFLFLKSSFCFCSRRLRRSLLVKISWCRLWAGGV